MKLNPVYLQQKFGFLGEPMTLGLFLGMFIGILGNTSDLFSLKAWGQILQVGIATSAGCKGNFPLKSQVCCSQAFAPITEAARKFMEKAGKRNGILLLSML